MKKLPFYLVEKSNSIARVFLNRPEKKNAMASEAWSELPDVFGELDRDRDIRAIIISGKGESFCAGIDLTSMVGELGELLNPDQSGGTKYSLLPKIRDLQLAISAIEACRKPIIAAIHGHCLGAGLDMATACDIRICSEDALFSLREAAVGFVADVGVLQRIPLIVGQGHARELAYTAKFITAQRAKEILLVNDIYPDYDELMAAADKLAAQIAANSPLAVQASKDVLNFCIGKSIDDGLRYVASVSTSVIPSADLREALSAFQQKRRPQFTGE